MKQQHEDRTVSVSLAPERFCPRRLTPTGPNCKRYFSWPKPLLGYIIACPSCGFQEMRMHDQVCFGETAEGTLVGAAGRMTCGHCQRTISIAKGEISARKLPL